MADRRDSATKIVNWCNITIRRRANVPDGPRPELKRYDWFFDWEFVRELLMKMRIKIASIAFLLVHIGGCASIYTQSHDAYLDTKLNCSDPKTIPNVYSGFVFDLYCIPAENAGFFCLVDLPLSFIIDSLILPYAIYKQSKNGNWYQQDVCQAKNQ